MRNTISRSVQSNREMEFVLRKGQFYFSVESSTAWIHAFWVTLHDRRKKTKQLDFLMSITRSKVCPTRQPTNPTRFSLFLFWKRRVSNVCVLFLTKKRASEVSWCGRLTARNERRAAVQRETQSVAFPAPCFFFFFMLLSLDVDDDERHHRRAPVPFFIASFPTSDVSVIARSARGRR